MAFSKIREGSAKKKKRTRKLEKAPQRKRSHLENSRRLCKEKEAISKTREVHFFLKTLISSFRVRFPVLFAQKNAQGESAALRKRIKKNIFGYEKKAESPKIKKMSSIQKIAVSLLLTVLLSAVFFATALSDVSKRLEARFYEPAVISSYLQKTNEAAKSLEVYLDNEKKLFAEYTLNSFVESFLQTSPSDIDVQMRTKITGDMFMSTTGLLGIRFLDVNGRYVHYSTFSTDILSRTQNRVEYKNYGELNELPFSAILAEDMGVSPNSYEELAKYTRVIFDSETEMGGRIIFSVPFYDKLSVFRGFLAFYVSASDFPNYLVSLGQSTLSTHSALVVSKDSFSNAGFLFNVPPMSSDANKALRLLLIKAAGEKWHSEKESVTTLNEADENDVWTLFSAQTKSGEKIGWLVKSDVFTLSSTLRIFFLASAAIVLFLIIFLVCCLIFRDKMQIVRKRIRRFQFHIIADYLEKKEKIDWQTIVDGIQLSKSDFSMQIKNSLGRVSKRKSREIDALLEKSWSDILSVIGAKASNSFSLEQLRRMLEDVLKNHQPSVQVVASPKVQSVEQMPSPSKISHSEEAVEIEEIDAVEELEEIGDTEEIEEIEEAEDAEEAEELLDVDEVEELEEISANDELPDDLKPKIAEDFKNNPIADDIAKLLGSTPTASSDELASVEDAAEQKIEREEILKDAESAEEIPEVESVEPVIEEKAEEMPSDSKNADENESESEDEIVVSEYERQFDEITADARAQDKIEDEKSVQQIFYSDHFVYQQPDFSFLDEPILENESESADEDFEGEAQLLPLDFEQTSHFLPLLRDVEDCGEELLGEEETEAVVEKNGVFVVAPNLNVAQSEKNQRLAELVDSVSHIRGEK